MSRTGVSWRQPRAIPPGAGGTMVMPFLHAEPSLGIHHKLFRWEPKEPKHAGKKFRAALEALAYMIALGVRQHEQAGQQISRISVSGGIARNQLMCEILASVLGRPLELLQSNEGSALGAAVTALAALENHRGRQQGEVNFTVADAVAQMVKFRAGAAGRQVASGLSNGIGEVREADPRFQETQMTKNRGFTPPARLRLNAPHTIDVEEPRTQ